MDIVTLCCLSMRQFFSAIVFHNCTNLSNATHKFCFDHNVIIFCFSKSCFLGCPDKIVWCSLDSIPCSLGKRQKKFSNNKKGIIVTSVLLTTKTETSLLNCAIIGYPSFWFVSMKSKLIFKNQCFGQNPSSLIELKGRGAHGSVNYIFHIPLAVL